jgi:hypothetical protein
MAGPGRSWRHWDAPGDGADHITVLPPELRARIAASLPFRQVAQLATLSRPWRHIHRHTPVVELKLDEWGSAAGVLDEDALACLELALLRRGQEGSGSRVGTLRVTFAVEDPRMRRHAGLIIALADARRIRITVPGFGGFPQVEWSVDLSPAAVDLEVEAVCHLTPAIAGPGAAALQKLCLDTVVVPEWPSLPSLRHLALHNVTVVAPFPDAARCPRLEHMCILECLIELACVHIRLPLLRSLRMDKAYGAPCATIDAPELEELDVNCGAGFAAADYQSFSLRAPRLRCLTWSEQFAERVHIDVGRPGSVTSGRIKYTWKRGLVSCREMEDLRAQMTRMLERLLPELSPEGVADAARSGTLASIGNLVGRGRTTM